MSRSFNECIVKLLMIYMSWWTDNISKSMISITVFHVFTDFWHVLIQLDWCNLIYDHIQAYILSLPRLNPLPSLGVSEASFAMQGNLLWYLTGDLSHLASEWTVIRCVQVCSWGGCELYSIYTYKHFGFFYSQFIIIWNENTEEMFSLHINCAVNLLWTNLVSQVALSIYREINIASGFA